MRLWRGALLPRLQPAVLLGVIALAEYASPWRAPGRAVALGLAVLLTARFVGQSVSHVRLASRVATVLRARLVELSLTAGAMIFLLSKVSIWARELADPSLREALDPVYRLYATGFLLIAGLRSVAGDLSIRRVMHRLELRPAETITFGFAAAILGGTLLLSVPLAVTDLEELSFLDVLFTATTAVTTTGLVVYDPATFHTPFGQAVLLCLMQLGGIGTMAASASLVVLAGRRLRMKQTAALREVMDLATLGDVRREIKTILWATVLIEGAGVLALYLLWRDRAWVEAPAFAAVFHAVSAFTTSGLSSFSAGLALFRDDAATNVVVGLLVTLGALGSPVLVSLARAARQRQQGARLPALTLHARLALGMTLALLLGGALLALLLEWGRSLAPLGLGSRLTASAFLAVSAQSTAGFQTLDTNALTPATQWVLMILMFVGGSPGSTAGGIKTTTAAAVLATLWATIQGREQVQAFRRTIPGEQVAKALALVGVSLAVAGGAVLALLATQSGEPLALTFEAVSAFGTVGLSAGVTPDLNAVGKITIILAMFIGRAGPLTLGFVLAARARPRRIGYPTEKIMIG